MEKRTLPFCLQPIRILTLVMGIIMCISVNAQIAIFTHDYNPNACHPQKLRFQASAPAALTYDWKFDDGTTIQTTTDTVSHTFLRGGNYKVQVVVNDNNGYMGTGTADVMIGGLSGNINTSTDSACIGEQVRFDFYPFSNGYIWNFDDPESGGLNISDQKESFHTFTKAGIFNVMLIGDAGCGVDTLFHKIYVGNNAIPSANFWSTVKTACPGDEINFSMSNYDAPSYKWTFGDPSSGSLDTAYKSSVSHAYITAGKYFVTLTVQNQCGQQNSKTDSIIITNTARFPQHVQIYTNNGQSNLKGCPGDLFELYTEYNTNQMLWKFGDGDSSIVKRPSHVYSENGTYFIFLTITNGCGFDTVVWNKVVIGGINSTFNEYARIEARPVNVCPGDNVNFEFKDKAISYLWNFGDGITSNKPNPSHSFLSLGVKNVTLDVTNGCGVDSTFNIQINVSDTIKPILSRSGEKGGNWGSIAETACPGDSILFYSFDGTLCVFDFGDGTVSSQTSKLLVDMGEVNVIKHAYSALGTYKVRLTIFNHCGKSTTDSLLITIGGSQPISGELGIISSEPYYTCRNVQFMASNGIKFTWYLPNGDSVVTNQNILNCSFGQPGNYLMKVKIENGCGSKALLTREINIINLPKPVIIQEFDKLIVKTDAAVYQWYRNGDSIPGADKAELKFVKSGQYTVKITDYQGCVSISQEYPICFVWAGEDISICPGGTAQLNAIGADSYSWSPSAGLSNTTIPNPTAQPASDTVYVVTGTTGGCIVTDSVRISLVSILNADAGKDEIICNGDSIILFGTGGGDYSWSPAASLINANTQFPIAKPVTNTTYTLTVSSGTCTDTDEVIVTVHQKPILNIVAEPAVCAGNNPQLQATYSNASGIEWKGIGGFFPNKFANTVFYTPSVGEIISGSANVYVNTTGISACPSNSKSIIIDIVTVPQPVIVLKNDSLMVQAGYNAYQWYKDGNYINGATEWFYKPTSNGEYYVNVMGPNSCYANSQPYNFVLSQWVDNKNGRYRIYPNPAQNFINLTTQGQVSRMGIYSLDGRLIKMQVLKGKNNIVSISELKSGTYIVKMSDSNNSVVLRLVKE